MLSFLLCFFVSTTPIICKAAYDEFYEELTLLMLKEQYNETTKFIPSIDIYPPLQWAKIKGLFSSTIHNNDVGRLSFLRTEHAFPDNNFFVTAWIAHILWEIRSLNITESISSSTNLRINDALSTAVHALQLFLNQNNDINHLSVSFWKQSYKNRCNYYCATEENLKHEISEIDAYILYLSIIAAEHGVNLTEILHIDYYDFYATLMYDESFGIPADFDDSSVALALTTFYKENMNDFNNAADIWLNYEFSSNIQSYINDLLKYNYKPFSDNLNENYIDARTYYWLRHFIYDSLQNGDIGENEKLMLVTTWQLTTDENRYNVKNHICYLEPFSVNNVDPTVGANTIFAITRSLIWFGGTEREKWFNLDVQQIYRNTTNLLIWTIQSNWINNRPELIFLYYPSKYDYYWFVSRIYKVYHLYIVNNTQNEQILIEYPFLLDIYLNLQNVLQIDATKQILDKVKSDENNGYYFWDEFLGNDDLNVEGHPDPHYDDRLFSTSMAINALLNIWTDCDIQYIDNQQYIITDIVWNTNTSKEIKDVVDGGIMFLRKESLLSTYRPDNAFFAGSQKTNETGPWNYPINHFETRNGTSLNVTNLTMQDLVPGISLGVSGYIDNETYQNMINKGSIIGPVPDQFYGYNMVGRPWPFWSSHPITHTTTLLAVGTYDQIQHTQ